MVSNSSENYETDLKNEILYKGGRGSVDSTQAKLNLLYLYFSLTYRKFYYHNTSSFEYGELFLNCYLSCDPFVNSNFTTVNCAVVNKHPDSAKRIKVNNNYAPQGFTTKPLNNKYKH